jgi:hypothetical protein
VGAVDAAYRQHAIDHGNAKVEKPERETVTPATRRIGAEDPEHRLAGLVNQLQGGDHPAEAAEPENLQVPGRTAAATQARPALDEHDAPTRDRTSDFYAVPNWPAATCTGMSPAGCDPEPRLVQEGGQAAECNVFNREIYRP